jgi:tRNA1Val (adenine37-N6)-methyltransferase
MPNHPRSPVADAYADRSACGMAAPTPAENDALTADHLLGGRVSYRQPRDGFRAAIDPVLLAAAVPARPGQRVLEGGTGAGAALLCLAARVPGISGLGIDREAGLLRIARANAAVNRWPDLNFAAADLSASPIGPASGGGVFDHAFANPPYHDPEGTRSPHNARETAKRDAPGQLRIWVEALARPLRHRGTLTIILPPRLLEPALVSMREAEVPAECVFPIWPKQGQKAKLLLISGRKHGRSPLVLAPGLILHTASGTFRPEAEAVLRDGAALTLTGL